MGLHIGSILWDLLHEADGVEFECPGCRKTTCFPFRMMVEVVRPSTKLVDVLPRLRCETCGAKGVSFLAVSLWNVNDGQKRMGLGAD